MLCKTIFAWSLVLPAALAVSIETQYSTDTATVCSTSYGKTSLSSVPTTTSPAQRTVELLPVMLHNTTTWTKTVTPDIFTTYFSFLETETKWITRTPKSGTFDTTSTEFDTSTKWYHASVTVTETKFRYLTSRTTSLIPAPTGFMPIRNTTSGNPGEESKRGADHPHPGLSARQTTKAKCKRPTSGKFPIGVECAQEVQLHTTEVLYFTKDKWTHVTLAQETFYLSTTVWGTITSTALSIPATKHTRAVSSESTPASETAAAESVSRIMESAGTTLASQSAAPSDSETNSSFTEPSSATESASLSSDSLFAAAPTSSGASTSSTVSNSDTLIPPVTSTASTTESGTPSASSSSTNTAVFSENGILTRFHTVTATPYTITFTWTSTETHVTTSTRHATTTVTSHAACATHNLLSVTSHSQRINGLAVLKGSLELNKVQTDDASACCEECMGDSLCAWSVWEAEGSSRGACYLYHVPLLEQCQAQWSNQGSYGFRGGNGEYRYVVSNGRCGFLSES